MRFRNEVEIVLMYDVLYIRLYIFTYLEVGFSKINKSRWKRSKYLKIDLGTK